MFFLKQKEKGGVILSKTSKFDTEAIKLAKKYGRQNPYLIHIGATEPRHFRTDDLFLLFQKKAKIAQSELSDLPERIENRKKELEETQNIQLPLFVPEKFFELEDELKSKLIQEYLDYEIIEYHETKIQKVLKHIKSIPKIIKKESLPKPTWFMVDKEIFTISDSTPFLTYKSKSKEVQSFWIDEKGKERKFSGFKGQLEKLFSSYLRVIVDNKVKFLREYLKEIALAKTEWEEQVEDFNFLLEVEKLRRHDDQVDKATHMDAADLLIKSAIVSGATEVHKGKKSKEEEEE